MMPYVQLPADMEEALGLLGDAERGRLVLAMLQYNRTGESVQLAGTERVLWPMIRERMDISYTPATAPTISPSLMMGE